MSIVCNLMWQLPIAGEVSIGNCFNEIYNITQTVIFIVACGQIIQLIENLTIIRSTRFESRSDLFPLLSFYLWYCKPAPGEILPGDKDTIRWVFGTKIFERRGIW